MVKTEKEIFKTTAKENHAKHTIQQYNIQAKVKQNTNIRNVKQKNVQHSQKYFSIFES